MSTPHDSDAGHAPAPCDAPETVSIPGLQETAIIPSLQPPVPPPYRRRWWPRLPLARWLAAAILATLAWFGYQRGTWDTAIDETAAFLRALEAR